MDRILRLPNELDELIEPDLRGVQPLPCAERPEAAGEDGEDDRLEDRRVLIVKGAVDEDVLKIGGRLPRGHFRSRLSYLFDATL